MENKNNNIFLGKIEKSGCYVNNGKYGYFSFLVLYDGDASRNACL